MDSPFDHWQALVTAGLSSVTVFSIVAHAVNTFPQPTNVYGKWLLSTIQFIVGQRSQALQTSQMPVAKPNKDQE